MRNERVGHDPLTGVYVHHARMWCQMGPDVSPHSLANDWTRQTTLGQLSHYAYNEIIDYRGFGWCIESFILYFLYQYITPFLSSFKRRDACVRCSYERPGYCYSSVMCNRPEWRHSLDCLLCLMRSSTHRDTRTAHWSGHTGTLGWGREASEGHTLVTSLQCHNMTLATANTSHHSHCTHSSKYIRRTSTESRGIVKYGLSQIDKILG